MRSSDAPTPHLPHQPTSPAPVLVAVGEAGGLSALRMGHALAQRDGGQLVIATVVEPPPLFALEAHRALAVPWTIEDQLVERRGKVMGRLHRLGWDARVENALHLDVVYGDPPREIARLAREHGARIIVMGIGPQSVARRLLADGTAATTARYAPCPVLAVAEGTNALPRNAVIALDFGAASINAARESLKVLADGAVLHLVHAWQRIETVVPLAELDAMNASYAASLPARFHLVRDLLGHASPVAIDTVALEGKPAEKVLAWAREHQADLVVAGSHGSGTLERWLLGSTATALLHGADSSVLLVPEPSVAEQTRLARHMTGTSTVWDSTQWNAELDAFVRRNRQRRTQLEIDAVSLGAQVQESGYALVGATYDRHDGHLALMFGRDGANRAHLTRSLSGVTSVSVASGRQDEDRALCIESGDGAAVLTFLDPATPQSSASP